MYYADLRRRLDGSLRYPWSADPDARDRAIARLQSLRAVLADPATPGAPPPRTLTDTLLLATWNIREFESGKWGPRLPEAYCYLAEVIGRFDLVAVQEVRSDLRALDDLVARLGPTWKYLVSDVTEGAAGNGERLAYLYDTRKVRFLNIAGELVIPPLKVGNKTVPSTQVARSPFMATFQVGWTKFTLATVHILYGDDTAEPQARVDEIAAVATFLAKRTRSGDEPGNIVILGDFNIFTNGDKTMKALTSAGFQVPQQIQDLDGSNLDRSKKYDQIASVGQAERFELTDRAGIFNIFDHVFRDDEADTYRPAIDRYIADQHAAGKTTPKAPKNAATARTQYRAWKTFQISDHLPMWVELRVDFSDDYLASLTDPT